MERYKIKAEVRDETGKGVARSLRRAGMVPAVVYGKEHDPQPLTLDPKELTNKIHGNAIFDLEIVGGNEKGTATVMIKDYQQDPVKGDIIHLDFQYINMNEKISVAVPVNIIGDAPGVKAGGVLQQMLREIEIEALPTNIPAHLDIDISELEINNSLQVSDLVAQEDIEIITSPEEVIVTIVAPTEEVEETEETEDEFAEPEVIGEDQKEEDTEE